MSKPQPFRDFTAPEHDVWRKLFARQEPKRAQQIVPEFTAGLKALGIDGSGIPDLERVNRRLAELTGFRGVPVDGLEESVPFFEMLARGEFPIGNFIREARDLDYTPAPDVFHDLYGHLPFLANEDYANFCRDLGALATRYASDPHATRQFERLFWFTVEFALQQTADGSRIFGAGIASSFGECAYALGTGPSVLAFDVDKIRAQEFRIDAFQSTLFQLRSAGELYSCLERFEAGLPAPRLKQSGSR